MPRAGNREDEEDEVDVPAVLKVPGRPDKDVIARLPRAEAERIAAKRGMVRGVAA